MEEKEKFKKPLCIRCETDLILVREEEDINEKEYRCPHCGVIELCYPCTDEDKKNYAWYNDNVDDNLGGCSHGYDGLCPQCGSHIVWGADFMRSEVLGDVENDEDDSLASSVSCPHCGASIDIIEAKPSEYSKYPAYNEKEE